MQTIYLPARNTVLTKMTWQKSSPITQTICLQIHKQGSLIRHLSFFLKPGGSQPTLANFLPPSTENLQNFRRQGKKKEMFHGLHVCSQKSAVPWAGNCAMFTACYQLLQLLLWGMKIKQANVYVNQRFPWFIDFSIITGEGSFVLA